MLGGWNDRVIMVTGGAGYLGSRLIRDFAEDPRFAGATIRILDNLQRGSYHALMDLPAHARYEFVEADILDAASVRRAVQGVDAVIHLAALVHSPFSFEHPRWTEHVNHWGTAQLVEHCLENGVERFLLASSGSVYGPGGVHEETGQCRPVGPYSISKRRAEEAVLAAGQRGLAVTVVRLATLFGDAPAVRFDAVPNRLAYLAAIGRPITVHGAGNQVRAVLDVADASDAVRWCVAEVARTRGEVFNAVAENVEIGQVAEVVAALRPGAEIRRTAQDVLTHFNLALSGEKLAGAGWRPRRMLADGMKSVLARLKGFQHWSTALGPAVS